MIGIVANHTKVEDYLYIQIAMRVGREENRENQRKHAGISFELAALVFEDECCVIGWTLWMRREKNAGMHWEQFKLN